MIALALDDTGDINFDVNAGVFSTVNDNDELAQHLSILLGINPGELAWNEELGLDHNDVIINGDNKTIVQGILDDYLKTQLDDSYGGIEINEFDVDYSQRLTALSATVVMDGDRYNTTLAISNSANENGDDSNATN